MENHDRYYIVHMIIKAFQIVLKINTQQANTILYVKYISIKSKSIFKNQNPTITYKRSLKQLENKAIDKDLPGKLKK